GRVLDLPAARPLAGPARRGGGRGRPARPVRAAGRLAGRAAGARRRPRGGAMSISPTARAYDRYRVWAPSAREATLRIDGGEHAMRPDGDGWFALPGVPAMPGARYAFRLDDGELWLPDPRSLSQPDGVHADSEVVDPLALRRRTSWRGRSLRG